MSALRTGSLCSGYEGLGMAVHSVLGGELAWLAEIDPDASRVLARRFPGVPNLGDISKVDWLSAGAVDVLVTGTPCQDVSQAGQRAGLRHGTRSGVWHEAVRAIAALHPSLVVIENVLGLLTARGDEPAEEHLAAEARRDAAARLLARAEELLSVAEARGDIKRVRKCKAITVRVAGFRKRAVARCRWHEQRLVRAVGTVLGTLAGLGFDAEWTVLSAADAGSCHLRKRVFIVAWPAADAERGELQRRGVLGVPEAGEPREGDQRERAGDAACGRGAGAPEDAHCAARGQRRVTAPGQAPGRRPRADAGRSGGAPAADAECDGRAGRTAGGSGEAHEPGEGSRAATAGRGPGAPADSERGRRDGRADLAERQPEGRAAARRDSTPVEWGPYGPAVARWEAVLGRLAPRPTEPGKTGERLSPAFVEWLMGLPAGWVTDVPGLSRNAMLKILGNGVVPQQAELALRLLLTRAGLAETVAAA